MKNVNQQLEQLKKEVESVCVSVDRNPKDIQIIAVSKNTTIEKVNQVFEWGHKDFGENRAQEFLSKHESLGDKMHFHFIGHMQRNKAKQIVGKAKLIHSVDSLRLLQEIEKQAKKKNIIQEILIQVDIAKEKNKFGASKEEVLTMLEENEKNQNVTIKGLMTMAPFYENEEDTRWVFQDLHGFFIDIKEKNLYNTNMVYLSMGMTNDFKIAIEEGANMIRIGSYIFGR